MLIEAPTLAPKPLDKAAAAAALVARTKRSLTILVGSMRTTRESVLQDLANNRDGLTPEEATKAFAGDAAELADILDTLGGIATEKGYQITPTPAALLPAAPAELAIAAAE